MRLLEREKGKWASFNGKVWGDIIFRKGEKIETRLYSPQEWDGIPFSLGMRKKPEKGGGGEVLYLKETFSFKSGKAFWKEKAEKGTYERLEDYSIFLQSKEGEKKVSYEVDAVCYTIRDAFTPLAVQVLIIAGGVVCNLGIRAVNSYLMRPA